MSTAAQGDSRREGGAGRRGHAAEPLLGVEAFERLSAAALDAARAAGAADAEVVVRRVAGGLTRFAASQVTSNVWREDLTVNVRVVTGDGRVGVAAAHGDDPATVAAAAEQATALAMVSPPNGEFPGFAPAADTSEGSVDDATLAASPADRAAAVREMLAEVPDAFSAAGAFSTDTAEVSVTTTAGQRAYAPLSSVSLNMVVMGPTSSGWGEAGGRALAAVDHAGAARKAVAKATTGADPREIPPGRYRVILEPPAVTTLLEFLALLGFNGRSYLEGRSFATGRLGERVTDPAITLVDDARSPDTIGLPFDEEGTPKQRLDLIRNGIVRAVAHDRATARQCGERSTGHALTAPNTYGPVPLNPLLEPGDGGTVDDLIAGCEHGLVVTRFHYTNVVSPKETLLTGMTRDGTFLVADGGVVGGVRNLRFTQSVLEALAEVEAVSTVTGWGSEFVSGGQAPALRLPSFAFTGTTSFG